MTMYNCVWLYITLYDYVWLYTTLYDYVWLCVAMYDYVWLHMSMGKREIKRERVRTILKSIETSELSKLFIYSQSFNTFHQTSTLFTFVHLC